MARLTPLNTDKTGILDCGTCAEVDPRFAEVAEKVEQNQLRNLVRRLRNSACKSLKTLRRLVRNFPHPKGWRFAATRRDIQGSTHALVH